MAIGEMQSGWSRGSARELHTTTSGLEWKSSSRKPCGHARHVGTCPCCQRAQLARWGAQLAQASPRGTVR